MAEIRSTLDIVMEKTKGLAMTDGEKRELISTSPFSVFFRFCGFIIALFEGIPK